MRGSGVNPKVLTLSPAEFIARRGAGELWQLVDVRESWERGIASVDQALAIPMADVPARVGELDRHHGIAVLCHTGVRSATVANWLAFEGFEPVANIEGGIDAWAVDVDRSLPRY